MSNTGLVLDRFIVQKTIEDRSLTVSCFLKTFNQNLHFRMRPICLKYIPCTVQRFFVALYCIRLINLRSSSICGTSWKNPFGVIMIEYWWLRTVCDRSMAVTIIAPISTHQQRVFLNPHGTNSWHVSKSEKQNYYCLRDRIRFLIKTSLFWSNWAQILPQCM